MSSELTPAKKLIAAYNSISGGLWGIVLFNTVSLSLWVGQPEFFQLSNKTTTFIQTLAAIEIYNAATGLVKSPVFTTVMQVLSRYLLVWGIFQVLPDSPANGHWSYITLSLCWSVTEIIRYFYYSQNILTNGNPPKILTILRYNTFYVLYPAGVASELTMVYLSLDEAKEVVGVWYYYLLIAVMFTYIPGFYTLYTHMIKQRKKAMKALREGGKESKEKKAN
ncbi:unnamed protein product [Kuraishia capsulata CBS 1993]|uniref:Very-long-chain (3R)-3-hydroxyacyl-CoA dehydratase n=1 Tax=Kuraishia capsulata CBS 1993 TaxID=1382522 RepID=W6MKW3_9ASCO|nr:uncharacterized protein KUCA_T00003013001 [Kuraishia capsulata CBS 1993]CDK27036.1 unnamed protein product [Kuraishia capsulata CBS 1993]